MANLTAGSGCPGREARPPPTPNERGVARPARPGDGQSAARARRSGPRAAAEGMSTKVQACSVTPFPPCNWETPEGVDCAPGPESFNCEEVCNGFSTTYSACWYARVAGGGVVALLRSLCDLLVAVLRAAPRARDSLRLAPPAAPAPRRRSRVPGEPITLQRAFGTNMVRPRPPAPLTCSRRADHAPGERGYTSRVAQGA